jgi:alpha-beta hydrolase superfamily lysophospholipase
MNSGEMHMIQSEFSWQSQDGLQFFGQEWRPEGGARAVVALIHGLGEHSGRYQHVADSFTQHGLGVVALDHRGHGRTGGKRGHGSYDAILDDIQHLIQEAEKRYPGLPVILYGHSLGGALVLYYALKRRPQVKGVISTAPGLIPANASGGQIALAKIMSAIAPGFQIDNGLDVSGLSHDPETARAYTADPLVHPKISARLGLDLMQNGQWVIEHAAEFPLPLLLLQGSADRLVNPAGARQFAAGLAGKVTYKVYDGWYHELHNEVEKETVLADMVAWIDQILG